MGKRHRRLMAGDDGWCGWEEPIEDGYKQSCCDCLLVHEMQFRVQDGRAIFRARRDDVGTAAARAHARGGNWSDRYVAEIVNKLRTLGYTVEKDAALEPPR